MTTVIKNNKWLVVLIAFMGVPLNGLGIDIFVPALPAIAHYYSVTKELAQLNVGVYLFGFGIVQLFVGGIVDSIGRRKPYLFGVVIYLCSTLLIIYAGNIYIMLVARFIQGVAIGCIQVSSRAIIFDNATPETLPKMANYMSITWSLAPIIAPALGGYLQEYFNWQATFWFLFIYALIVGSLFLKFVPETLQQTKKFSLEHLLSGYTTVLSSGGFWVGALCLGVVYSSLVLFNTVAPFLIEEVLKHSPIFFGYVALSMGAAWMLGGIINRILSGKSSYHLAIKKRINYCLIIVFISVVTMISLSFYSLNVAVVAIPMAIIIIFSGIMFPNYFAANMALFPKLAGTCGALTGALAILLASVYSSIGTLLKTNTQLPLAISLLASTFILYLLNRLHEKNS